MKIHVSYLTLYTTLNDFSFGRYSTDSIVRDPGIYFYVGIWVPVLGLFEMVYFRSHPELTMSLTLFFIMIEVYHIILYP